MLLQPPWAIFPSSYPQLRRVPPHGVMHGAILVRSGGDISGGGVVLEAKSRQTSGEEREVAETSRDCAVVLNAGAGSLLGDEAAREALEETFIHHGLRPHFSLCASGDDIDGFVREALEQNMTTVIAGGGDGTVSTVASHLVDTDAALGVLPLGTLNHFAKDLGIPLDREEAVATIASGRVVKVDAAEVNGVVFINNSSLGLYPLAVRLREEEQRRGSGKWIAFAKAALRVLGRYPLLRVHLTIDGNETIRRTPILFIGNNHYELEGLEMTRRARVDEGILSICITRDVGRVGLFGLLARAVVGRLQESRDFSLFEASELWIETSRGQIRVATDGETRLMQTPLRYRSRAGALNVIVPPNVNAKQSA
jgi:diacylglycerol kinase family enzyme